MTQPNRLLVLVTALASIAAAPVSDFEAARGAFDAGVGHLDAGEHRSAIEAFERSLALRFSLSAQYNLGLAQRAAGDDRAAIAAFERFLDAATERGHTDGVEHARTLVEALRARLVHLNVSVVGVARDLRLNGDALGDSAGELALVLAPGTHVLTYEDTSGARHTRRAELAPGARTTVTIDARPPLPKVTPPPPPPSQVVASAPAADDTAWVWWVGGAAIVAAAAGAALVTYAITRPGDPEYDGGSRDVVLRGLAPRAGWGGAL